jgi:O-acetyl-ADP-ribose deacetylase (regulator of RNase III)
MKKKGHSVLELQCDSDRTMQVVTGRSDIVVGHTVLAALPGELLENGKLVRREKTGGEWSEGALIDVVDAGSQAPQVSPQNSSDERFSEEDESEDGDHDDIGPAGYQVLPCDMSETSNSDAGVSFGSLIYVNGDASKANHGKGKKIIAHVCNDMGLWGKGFVMAITDSWGKHPGKLYRKWHKDGAGAHFGLGSVQLVTLTDMVVLANIIGQNGIKTGSKGPPVRYEAIHHGLDAVCWHAVMIGASVHMPRIGSGLAGGEWLKIETIIESMTKKHSVDIYVYEYNK